MKDVHPTPGRFRVYRRTSKYLYIFEHNFPDYHYFSAGCQLLIRIRGPRFLIFDQEMKEVVLGRQFLKAIGFDLHTNLENIGSLVHNFHMEDPNPTTVRAAAPSYKELVYREAVGDPIELLEAASAGIRKDSTESIDTEFLRISSKSIEKGLRAWAASRVAEVMDKFRNTF